MGKKITVADVVSDYGISERTCRRYIAEGRLVARRVGPRMIRLDADEVEAALFGTKVNSNSA